MTTAPGLRPGGPGLFSRILLWFLGTVLIVMAVTTFMIWFAQEEIHQEHLKKSVDFLHRELASLLPQLESGAQIAFHKPFGPPSPPMFVFDSQGKPLFSSVPFDLPGVPGHPFHEGPFPGSRSERPPRGRDWDRPWANPSEIASIALRVLNGQERSRIIEARNDEFIAETVVASSGKRFVGLLGVRQPPSHVMRQFFVDPAMGLRLLVLVGIAIGLCWFLARSIASPVLDLQRLTRRLAVGDFQERLPEHLTSRGDELGNLARDFTSMASTIEEVIKSHRQLLRDVSHELRSPLARIQIALALIQKDIPPEKSEIGLQIEQNLGRLNELIQQLLDLSRLEQFRSAPLAVDQVDLAAVVGKIVADVRFEAELQRKTIRSIFPSQAIRISAIREFFRRAVENVLRNAVRHAPENSGIDLMVLVETLPTKGGEVANQPTGLTHNVVSEPGKGGEANATRAIIRIRDRGPGVPSEHLARLFEPFFRCEEDRARQSGGIGLGLAIVKRAIEAHEGSVMARNHPEGGLEVELALPATLGDA